MNKILIDNKTIRIVDNKHIVDLVQKVLNIFEIKNSLLEILFVAKKEIQKLNKEFRQVDAPTDVLSFPQPEIPGAQIKILGSIVISIDVLEEKGEDVDDVIKHGVLHLLNFDHERDEKLWEESAQKINCKL